MIFQSVNALGYDFAQSILEFFSSPRAPGYRPERVAQLSLLGRADEIVRDALAKSISAFGIIGRMRDRQAGKKFHGAAKIVKFLLASSCR
jgi:hypothetical protein